jgi:HWE histidine kinase
VAHYDVTAEPLRDAATGEVVGLTVAALDVTPHFEAVQALRRQEGHQRLLMNELNHRVKNTLAVVQSIAAQTLRGASDPRAAGAALQARLIALAAAHDVLTRKSWEGAPLREVLEAALAPHRTGRPPRRTASPSPGRRCGCRPGSRSPSRWRCTSWRRTRRSTARSWPRPGGWR